MSSDRISAAVLEDFVKRVRVASKSNQKEIKLSLGEAENLAYNLNIAVLKLLDRAQSAETRTAQEEVIRINMDGGSL